MRSLSDRTVAVFRYLMQRMEPATSKEIADAVGLEHKQVVSVVQTAKHIFVCVGTADRPGGGMKPALWAAWEE